MQDVQDRRSCWLCAAMLVAIFGPLLYLIAANFHVPRYRGTMIGVVTSVRPVPSQTNNSVFVHLALADGTEGTAVFPAMTAGIREGNEMCVSVSSVWVGPIHDAWPVDPARCEARVATP